MKRILSIALSLLLLVNIIPTNNIVRAQEVNTEANVVEAAEIKEYTNSGDLGTENNPIVMYVGDSIKLTSAIKNQGGISTRWSHKGISGTNVVTYNKNQLKNATSQTTTVKATAIGNSRLKLEWTRFFIDWISTSETFSYFYITVIEKPQTAGINQPNQMLFTKDTEWINYNEGIAKINLNAKNTEGIQGSDVIIIMDKSSSMSERSRWTTQKAVVTNITTDLLNSASKNNRVAVVSFAGDVGGSFNFKTNQQDAISNITSLSIKTDSDANGTNYSLALQQAINFANSRENSSRPLHVIFMTDGEYTGKNSGQAQYLVLNGMATTMKAMGIELKKAGRQKLSALFGATNYIDTTALTINTNITNLMVLIAEKHTTASEAIITDTIAPQYTAVIGNSLYPASTGVQLPASGNDVIVNIGAMATNDDYSYSYFVKINEEDRNTDSQYDTSLTTILSYKVATDSKSVSAVIPKLTTKTGSIVVNYVLDGKVVDQNIVVNLSIRNKSYSVTPVAPRGYKLVSEAPELRTLTYENNHQTIDFAVTKLSELHVNYIGMQDMDNTKVVVDPKIYYEGEKAILLGANTITHTIDGVNYYLAGWTTDKSLLTNDRVLVQTRTELNNLTLENFGKEVPVTSDLSYYAVWVPENINSTFIVVFINEGAAYQPTGFEFDHVYSYGEKLLKPVDPSKDQTRVGYEYTFAGWKIQGTELIVDVANSENPVLVKGNTIYQATYTETARKDLSFRIQFVDGNNVVLAPAVTPVVIPTPETPLAPTPEVVTEEIVTPEIPQANEPSVDIRDEETPKAESTLSWAFINLLMMILTAFASIVLLMMQVIGRKKGMNKTALIRLFSILPAVVSIIAFFVTENMMNPMIMFDKWTLMMVLIAAVQVVVIAFSLKKVDAIEENIER